MGLIGVRGEAPELASSVRDLMQIHQREHYSVEHRQHLASKCHGVEKVRRAI